MKFLLVVMMLVACGTDEGSKDPAQDVESTQGFDKRPEHNAYYVDSSDELMACDKTTKDWLVYTRKEEKFFNCDGKDWVEVLVKGEDGEDGQDGEDGSDNPIPENAWLDALTGKYWIVSGAKMNFAAAQSFCTNGWSLPSVAEIDLAADNGLLLDLNRETVANIFAWTTEAVDTFWAKAFRGSTYASSSQLKAELYWAYCYK